ncbi:molybdopterin molybdotransferase MoeA [Pseudonocardia sp.]|uniref:molybdopterin molybdotransferase MoeA n=1 Tax=Pseudonocardia sp. TaxID=60912 RepID=UPI003D13A6A0
MTPGGIAWDEARLVAHRSARRGAVRSVPLPQALGAVLAAPLVSQVSLPPAACSAMDGFAVSGPGPWALLAAGPLRPGEAVPVVTGAPVPAGTTTVLPVEDATVDGVAVDGAPDAAVAGATLHGRVEPGRHIRPAGEECTAGDVVLPAGGRATPAVLGLAAALGYDAILVHRPPAVAALVTGDELAETGLPAPGRTRDAIGPMLPGLVAAAGGRLIGAARVPDRSDAFRDALATNPADLVLLSGASGKGPADHLRSVLHDLGAELLVDGVACRPGHPQTLARLPGGRLLVGLPGNPFAALTAFLTLAVPAVAGFCGAPLPELQKAPARGFAPHDHSHRVVPARLVDGVAEPLDHRGPAMLRGVAAADCLAVVDPGTAGAVRLMGPGGTPWAG